MSGQLSERSETREQETYADYARAESYLPWNVKNLIFMTEVTPHWIGESDRFWYLRSSRQGKEFILVDPERGMREPAFDHVRLAAALSRAAGTPYDHTKLPFSEIEFVDEDQAIRFTIDGFTWRCDLGNYECTQGGRAEAPARDEVRSPDGRWAAFTRDGDLYLRDLSSGTERRLTDDAEPYYDYASHPDGRQSAVTDRTVGRPLRPGVRWSPDSTKLLTYKLDQRQVEPMYLLQSTPEAGVGSWRPVLHSYRYALPSDEHVEEAALVVFDVESGKAVWAQTGPLTGDLHSPVDLNLAWWSQDGRHVYAVRGSRDRRKVELLAIDAETGATRTILEEGGSGQVYPDHIPTETAITNVHEIGNGEAFTWFSAKSGWGHLYLIDGASGEQRQLTDGAWTVRDVVHIDEDGRRVYFTAGGREPGRDPYYRHLYRVSLDGGEPELLTPEDTEHTLTGTGRRREAGASAFSPSGAYFVDTFSRIDRPPTSVLRSADGRLVLTLEEADISGLLERGWRYPERFSVKARDGVTDIYGSIIRPSTYDPTKTYPVLDANYPGPQTIRTPKAFPAANSGFWQDQALAELGFIVVTIDGFGTPWRSRAFHDVASGKDFGEAGGLLDHVVGITQLGARDPSMDLDRVGIYGHSGGGYASARAMLKFPDFYKVAVSSAGNHDNRGYVALWAEGWMGAYDAETYSEQDNISLAANLKGKLLLVHGELDDNVHPSLTLRLVDALIAADKDFDMLIIPHTNHGLFDTRRGLEVMETARAWGNPYFTRKRWDYFVRHLRGAEPPEGFHIRQPQV